MEEVGGGCALTVRDVADLLRAQYAIVTGGKSRDGCPLLTFPDTGNFCNLAEEDYRRLIVYLTSVPTLQDADLGFVIVVDRRRDKWNSVTSTLLKISVSFLSLKLCCMKWICRVHPGLECVKFCLLGLNCIAQGFFPGLIQVVFVLKPTGLLQKAFSEISKLFKEEDFKFKVVVCECVKELQEHLDVDQLTKDLDGCIGYDHEEWIRQRMAVEKFSSHTHEVSRGLLEFKNGLQETELPNDVDSTRELLRVQSSEFALHKDELRTTAEHGHKLLVDLRGKTKMNGDRSGNVYPENKLINVAAVQRLQAQLEETERAFDEFWSRHQQKLLQCLELRHFEQDFRELQANLDSDLKELNKMTELGDTAARAQDLIEETEDFRETCMDDVAKANRLREEGENLIERNSYAVDSIRPKCAELTRMSEDLVEKLSKRLDSLNTIKELLERIDKANRWCNRGMEEHVTSLQSDKCSYESAEMALEKLDEFLRSSAEFKLDNPSQFRNIFNDLITPETSALVKQVLQRIEDVKTMCEKRRCDLKRRAERPARPVQTVIPEPAVPLLQSPPALPQSSSPTPSTGSGSSSPKSPTETRKAAKKTHAVTKRDVDVGCSRVMSSAGVIGGCGGGGSGGYDRQTCLVRQRHVLTELLDTERIYVCELKSIIHGYKREMSLNALVPTSLIGNEEILFGNIEEIAAFHEEIFLRDLETCIGNPELIGMCFIQRKEAFHNLYSVYCQNKTRSEAMRRDCGDETPFFKECQKRLGHKLPLSAYLLKPVQRITKYQLLLKDLLRFCENGQGSCEMQEALDSMLSVLRYVNDSIHQVAIIGFKSNLSDLGRLLMQDSFNVCMERKGDRLKELRLKPMQRRIFLYDKAVLFCKRVGKSVGKGGYHYKHCLKMSQVGLTENVKGDGRKFELWLQSRAEVYIIQASSVDVKDLWVKEIKHVLLEQFEYLKGEKIRQHSVKMHKLPSSANDERSARGFHHVLPGDYYSEGAHGGSRSKRASGGSGCSRPSDDVFDEEQDDGWSSEFSNSEDEGDAFRDNLELASRFVALSDYNAVDGGEVTLREGDIVELMKVGCAGWWFVRVVGTASGEGWAPGSYLRQISKRNSRSSPSASSQDSGNGGMLHATSKSSVTSSLSENVDT